MSITYRLSLYHEKDEYPLCISCSLKVSITSSSWWCLKTDQRKNWFRWISILSACNFDSKLQKYERFIGDDAGWKLLILQFFIDLKILLTRFAANSLNLSRWCLHQPSFHIKYLHKKCAVWNWIMMRIQTTLLIKHSQQWRWIRTANYYLIQISFIKFHDAL